MRVLIGVFVAIAVGVIAFTSWKNAPLENGILHVPTDTFHDAILIENRDVTDVQIYLIFPFGEAANPHLEGLAHYVEHLAWLSAFEEDEGGGRHSNAWTTQYATGYWASTYPERARQDLQELLGVADPIALNPDFALEERNIVQREYDFRVTEMPLYPIHRDMDRLLYGTGALSRSVIGEPEGIAGYTPEIAQILHEQSHRLDQATLVVYGNLRGSAFRNIIAALPTTSPGDPVQVPALIEAATIEDDGSVVVPDLSEQIFLYRKLTEVEPCTDIARCEVILQLAEDALNTSLPGGLAGPLRFDAFIARGYYLDLNLIADRHVELTFQASPDVGVTLQTLQEAFNGALNDTLSNGLPQGTFDRVQERFRGGHAAVLEQDRPGVTVSYVLEQLNAGKPVYTLEDEENAVASIRLQDVNQLLNELRNEGRVVTRRATPGE